MKPDAVLIGMLNPFDTDNIAAMAGARLRAFALEAVPRITRAQSMDVLSSQANIAGYKAVMMAANTYQRFMPMLMTAAGTVKAARVLIMGVGVAGLQAIATAKRLGRRDRGVRCAPAGQGAGRVARRQVHRRALPDRGRKGNRQGFGRLCALDAGRLDAAPGRTGTRTRQAGRHHHHHRAHSGPRRAGAHFRRDGQGHEARFRDRRPWPCRRAATARCRN